MLPRVKSIHAADSTLKRGILKYLVESNGNACLSQLYYGFDQLSLFNVGLISNPLNTYVNVLLSLTSFT